MGLTRASSGLLLRDDFSSDTEADYTRAGNDNWAGLATVDAGLVLFPLSSVQIRTAAAGGGDLVAEITSGTLADMGGGDAFAYSAGAAKYVMVVKA